MEVEFESELHRSRRRRSCSFILASLTAVVLYLVNVVVTGVFCGLYIDSYVESNLEYDFNRGCFLFYNKSQSDELCDVSLSGILLLFFLEIVLVVLGTVSLVLGKRSLCPRCIEVALILVCLVIGIGTSMVISVGIDSSKDCKGDSVCGKHEKYILILCWAMVVFFFLPLLVHFTDCMFNLPSRRNLTGRTQENHWFDERLLLTSRSPTRYNT